MYISINFSSSSQAHMYKSFSPEWVQSFRSRPDASLPFTSSVPSLNYPFEIYSKIFKTFIFTCVYISCLCFVLVSLHHSQAFSPAVLMAFGAFPNKRLQLGRLFFSYCLPFKIFRVVPGSNKKENNREFQAIFPFLMFFCYQIILH